MIKKKKKPVLCDPTDILVFLLLQFHPQATQKNSRPNKRKKHMRLQSMMMSASSLSSSVKFLCRPKASPHNHSNAAYPFHKFTCNWNSKNHSLMLPTWVSSNGRRRFDAFKSFSGQQVQKQEDEQAYEFERLFSNLNQATLKREPGNYQYYAKFLYYFLRKG